MNAREKIRPGYKQTEVGLIPEDWDVVPMGSLGVFSKGQGIRKDEAYSGDIPCIRYGEIYTHHNDVIHSFNSRISIEVAKSSKRLNNGDILFAGSGETKEEIGKCVAFVGAYEAYAGGDVVILNPKKGDSYFFGYLFNAPIVAKQKSSKGQGDAVVHISATALSSVQIPLPPTKEEQTAIAAALSDADALIAALEALIAKKRDLKQGAMQQLLTGKTRLPGFTGEWKNTTIGNIADVKTGPFGAQLHESDYVNVGTPIITVEHLAEFGIEIDDDVPLVSDADFDRLKAYQLIEGDIVFSRVGSVDRNALVRKREIGWLFSGRLLRVRPNASVYPAFLSYLFHTTPFKNRVLSVAVGQTMASLNTKILKGIEISLPSAQGEQTAIAAILSDMDADLAALEARRDKARVVKQGMMQELLTGRIRLV